MFLPNLSATARKFVLSEVKREPAFIVIFIITYLWAYFSIVRFKLQRWIRR